MVFPVDGKLLVGSRLSFSGTQIVYKAFKVFFQLPVLLTTVIQDQWQMVQKVTNHFQTHVCTLIILDVCIFLRASPHRSCYGQRDGFTSLCLAPEVHEERKPGQRLHQYTGKRCSQQQLDFQTLCLPESRHVLKPSVPAPDLLDAVIDLTVTGIPIKHNLRVIWQEPALDPAQLGAGILHIDCIIIGIFHICQITDQKLCIFTGHGDTAARQRHNLIG